MIGGGVPTRGTCASVCVPTGNRPGRSMNRVITIGQLEAAINRARMAQPASGPESTLTREVSALGGIYGRLIWERKDRIELEALSQTEQIALQLWLPPEAQ